MVVDPAASADEGRPAQRGFSRVLLASLIAGVLLHLVGFVVFRVVYRDLPDREAGRAFVQFLGPDPASSAGAGAWDESAALLDSAPLFVPTRWNASADFVRPDIELGPMIFASFSPSIRLLDDLVPARLFARAGDAPVEPASLLDSRFWTFFRGFGADSGLVPAFPDTGTVALVEGFGDGPWPMRIDAELPPEVLPGVARAATFHVRKGWGELGFHPLLVRSSGSREFDTAAAEWLGRAEVWARLPSGYSSVKVFP